MEKRIVGVDAKDFKEACEKFMRGEFTEFKTASDYDYCIKLEGNKTIVTRKDGKVGVAYCNPADAFDVVEGFSTALKKIAYSEAKINEAGKTLLQWLKLRGVKKFYLEEDCIDINIDDADEEPDRWSEETIYYYNDEFENLEKEQVYDVERLLNKN